jgi:hypothetical protein
MRRLSVAATVAALLFAGACRREEDPVSKLPELPDELRATLAPSAVAPVLMTGSKTVTPPARPAQETRLRPAISTVCVRHYKGYVIYPITVCYPPSFLVNGLNVEAVQARINPAVVPLTGSYKLSSFPGMRVPPAFYCTVRGGPWYAEVTETPTCENPLVSTFRLDIIAAPQPVEIVWTGMLTDAPAPINPNLLMQTSEDNCTCCNGGTLCPNGSCPPPGSSCSIHTSPPAARKGRAP